MNTPGAVRDSDIFTEKCINEIMDGLEGQDLLLVRTVIDIIREAGIAGNQNAVSLAKKMLNTTMTVQYKENWPQWAERLFSSITHLESRMQGSGVSTVQARVSGALRQAATWDPDTYFGEGFRNVAIEEGLQAAEPQDTRGIGVSVAQNDEFMPRNSR